MKKVLRAIGGFFARIGRWIANTAWVQPLLIVGGIFGIIFSIPYIKKGIEGLIAANTVDEKLAYYTNRKVSLTYAETNKGESDLDKLFNNLEELIPGDTDSDEYKYIKNTYGEKFFLTFTETTCSNCKEVVNGFTTFESKFYGEYKLNKDPVSGATLPNFNLRSVMADTLVTDSNSVYYDKYAAQLVLDRHQSLLEEIVGEFAEEKDSVSGYNYRLLNNVDDSASIISSINKLLDIDSEGIDVPMTFLIDITGDSPDGANVHGITTILFNFTSLIDDSSNIINQAQFLRDCWTYSNIFSATGKEINYFVQE